MNTHNYFGLLFIFLYDMAALQPSFGPNLYFEKPCCRVPVHNEGFSHSGGAHGSLLIVVLGVGRCGVM